MARHSNKHKKAKHKKSTHSSSSSKSRSKKVSFEGTSSGVETNDSTNKTIRHHSTKSHTSKQRSTGEISKHRQRSIPSIKSSGSSSTIQSPVSQKVGAGDKPGEKEVHPYAARFSEAIRRKTEHLLTTLSEQLMAIYSDTLECIPLANISEPSGKSYQSLVKALQTSILSEYGSPMPLGLVKEFQGNCKAWDQEFRTLLEEYNVVQQELMDLAKEIGVHSGDNAGKVVGEGVDMDSETEFGEMVEELKQTTKTWTTKMEKLENQIFQEESRQNMLMMQAI